MPISDKTRKVLWGRSGNRCALCRTELVSAATSNDPEAVIGEECHIVSRAAKGPRFRTETSGDVDLDCYDNLILLCGAHHKLIDDQPNTFTAEALHVLKAEHEAWVRASLQENRSGKSGSRSVRLSDSLRHLTTGREVLQVVRGTHLFEYDNSELVDKEEVRFVGDFLQEIRDWGDLLDVVEVTHIVQAEFDLTGKLADLEQLGFILYGGRRERFYHINGSREKLLAGVIYIARKVGNHVPDTIHIIRPNQ